MRRQRRPHHVRLGPGAVGAGRDSGLRTIVGSHVPIAGAPATPMSASMLIFAPSFAGTVLGIGVAAIAGMRRSGPAWPYMVLLGIAVGWWCFGQTFWILADTP